MFTVSIRMFVGDKPLSSVLSGAANGTGYNLFYPLSFNGTETGQADDWTVSQPFTRAYADPNTTPVCIVITNTGEGISLQSEISGYLVNVP